MVDFVKENKDVRLASVAVCTDNSDNTIAGMQAIITSSSYANWLLPLSVIGDVEDWGITCTYLRLDPGEYLEGMILGSSG